MIMKVMDGSIERTMEDVIDSTLATWEYTRIDGGSASMGGAEWASKEIIWAFDKVVAMAQSKRIEELENKLSSIRGSLLAWELSPEGRNQLKEIDNLLSKSKQQ